MLDTITLNPKLFNVLLSQGLISSNEKGTYTEQDGKKYKVLVVSASQLAEYVEPIAV